MKRTTRTVAIGAVAAVAVAGGGAALATTQLGGPKEESQKIVAAAANDLGVTPSELQSALEKAMKARVDSAVAAGRLSDEQGEALKKRIDSGELPLFAGPGMGFHGRGGFGHHGFRVALETAATYLGVSEEALRTRLEAGTLLADVAKAEGKPVDGLVDALVAEQAKKIDAAVEAGRLTEEQATSLKDGLEDRVTDVVNGTRPAGPGPGRGHGHPWRGADAPAVTPAGVDGPTI